MPQSKPLLVAPDLFTLCFSKGLPLTTSLSSSIQLEIQAQTIRICRVRSDVLGVVVVVIRDVIINVIVIIDSVIVGRDSKDETSTNTRKGLRDERERRDVRL